MYTHEDFDTGAEVKRAFKEGRKITVFQPGGMFAGETDGRVCIEGPHYPRPHRWYLSVQIEDSVITRIHK